MIFNPRKEIIDLLVYWGVVQKCQNLTFKVNFHLPVNPNLKIQLFPLSMLILIGKNLYNFVPPV